jgi:hypothetical protein
LYSYAYVLGKIAMPEPVPFFGWIDDYEETEQMLRDQIHAQQKHIEMLEQECLALRNDLKGKNEPLCN